MCVARQQYTIREWNGDSTFSIGGHTSLVNNFYEISGGALGIVKVPGLPAAEAARADSLFPPSIRQQKETDISAVRQLSAEQKLSAERELSALQAQLSGLNAAYVSKATQGWQYADAPYNYLNGFPWAQYTDWSTIDDGCWDYIWANIEDDQTLPTENEKYERMYGIEDEYNVWMEDNGGWDAWNAVYDCNRGITNLSNFIRNLPRQAQISVDTISASTDYHVEIPDVSWLTAYVTKGWDNPEKPFATGSGRFGAGIICRYPAVSSDNWTDLSSIVNMTNGVAEWPLPQYAYAKMIRHNLLSVEDCIPTKYMYYIADNPEGQKEGGVYTAQNHRYINMRYLSADQDYIAVYSGTLQNIGEAVGYNTKSMLSGERPDLRQYVQNYEQEENLSAYMPPDVPLSVDAWDSGSTCIYEGSRRFGDKLYAGYCGGSLENGHLRRAPVRQYHQLESGNRILISRSAASFGSGILRTGQRQQDRILDVSKAFQRRKGAS